MSLKVLNVPRHRETITTPLATLPVLIWEVTQPRIFLYQISAIATATYSDSVLRIWEKPNNDTELFRIKEIQIPACADAQQNTQILANFTNLFSAKDCELWASVSVLVSAHFSFEFGF